MNTPDTTQAGARTQAEIQRAVNDPEHCLHNQAKDILAQRAQANRDWVEYLATRWTENAQILKAQTEKPGFWNHAVNYHHAAAVWESAVQELLVHSGMWPQTGAKSVVAQEAR